MNSQAVQDLFSELLEISPERRQQYLTSVDRPEEIKNAANRLITASESPSEFLNKDLLSDLANLDPDFFEHTANDIVLKAGDRVGNYTVEAISGEGGMSIVYEAIQTQPIKRRVALKLIRPSVLAPRTKLRFFREQQALAVVAHPNIATLFEVGTTKSGHPFAAMEFVDGLPITDFCEAHRVNDRFRIELFIKACQGLSKAHRHGIIHRDIKPENVLIGIHDRMAVPKLIDFGIAKFVSRDLENNKTMTQPGQVLGSPRYMSPEQIEGRIVDERSDVFSAGLVLFELLSRSPYRKGDTAELMMSQARTAEIELLSDRIRSDRQRNEHKLPNASFNSLLKTATRDLNWILEKALAREPEDRYQSIDLFLADLKASFLGQPVSVSTPGPVRRAQRFIKTNRRSLAAIAATALIVVGSLVFYNWRQSVNELSEIKLANQVSEERNAASNDLIIRLFASHQYQLTPEQFDLTSIRMYQGEHDQINKRGGPQTDKEKSVYGILAVFYAMSGSFDKADELMEQVTDLEQRSELHRVREKICENYAADAKQKLALLPKGDRSVERARQQLVLGRCYIVLDMLKDSEKLINDAIEIFDSSPSFACDSLIARNTLAKLYEQAGKNVDHAVLLEKTYSSFKDNQTLLATDCGKNAFTKTSQMLAASSPEKFGELNQ